MVWTRIVISNVIFAGGWIFFVLFLICFHKKTGHSAIHVGLSVAPSACIGNGEDCSAERGGLEWTLVEACCHLGLVSGPETHLYVPFILVA